MLSTLIEALSSQMMVLTVPVLIIEKLTYSKETVNLVMAVQLVFYLLFIGILYFLKVNVVVNGIIHL